MIQLWPQPSLQVLFPWEYFMSVDLAQFDQRLVSIEAALAQVQRRLGLAPSSANWVEQVAGSLADTPEEDYQQFLECCRAVRNEGSPSAAAEPRP